MGNTEEEIPFFNIMLPTLMKRVPELELHQLKKKKKLNGISLITHSMSLGCRSTVWEMWFDLSVLYKVYQIHGWASTALIMWLVNNVSGLGRRHWGDNEWVWCRRIRWGDDSWNDGIDLVSIFYYYYVFLLLLPFVIEVLAPQRAQPWFILLWLFLTFGWLSLASCSSPALRIISIFDPPLFCCG